MVSMTGCIYNISLLPESKPLQEKVVGGEGAFKIALIEISGFISEQKDSGFFEKPDMVSRVKEELKRAAQDPAVKGIVLRVNSPGGTITASDLIYHEVRQFKKQSGKPVVVSILDVGASGAYYIAMAADRVLAHPTSVVGSIGVIMTHVNLEGLMDKVGVKAESIKSGENKDLGSPTKALSPEGREIMQGIIDDMYGRFLKVIETGRPELTPARIKALADGRVYTASDAKARGLIDEIAYLDQAIDRVKIMAGVEEAKVILYSSPGEYSDNIYSQSFAKPADPFAAWGLDPRQLLRGASPQFLYLWMP